MTNIEQFKLRHRWMQSPSLWAMLPPAIGIIIMVVFIIALWRQYRPAATAPITDTTVQEHRSADGKIICYSRNNALSCLPVWMLEPPNSWLVTYTPPKRKGNNPQTREK